MKYLTGLMLLMLAHIASAIECRVNGGSWVNAQTRAFNVYVDVKPNTALNKILLDGYALDCKHGMMAAFNPYLTISPTANIGVELVPPFGHLQGGLRVGSTFYPIPVWAGTYLAVQRNESFVSVSGRPYLDITRASGSYIEIKSGVHIATVNMAVRYSDIFGARDFILTVFVYARNSLNLNPSTCTINNNNPITVDFGSVDPAAIGGDIPAGTPYREVVGLGYSCPDPGIDTPMDIKLVGTASSFNSSALATSNPDLATAMIRVSSLVAPGGSFRTSITNSSGGDTVLFTLFRKTGSFPDAGPFTGSATLVMSVP